MLSFQIGSKARKFMESLCTKYQSCHLVRKITLYLQAERMRELTSALKMVLPKEEYMAFKERAAYWAPECWWENAANFVSLHFAPDPTNYQSVYVYSALCGCTFQEQEKRMREATCMKD